VKIKVKNLVIRKRNQDYVISFFKLEEIKLWNYPFKNLSKFYVCAIKNTNSLKCVVCKNKKSYLFTIVNKKRFNKLNILGWNWLCKDCFDLNLILYKEYFKFNDLEIELVKNFIKIFQK